MGFLFTEPVLIVPILLAILIILVFIAIIGLAIRRIRVRRMRMNASIRKMKQLNAAVANLNLKEQEKRVEENRRLLEYTPQKAEKQKKEAKTVKKAKAPAKKKTGDKTIYDDRKNLSTWQVHLSKTYRAMKKKNPKATFQAAMKAAKKTYKKKSKK